MKINLNLKMKSGILAMMLILLISPAFAQEKITGVVTDENGAAMPGVSVLIKGTTIGTSTNTDGTYVLQSAPANAILVFSFIGYKTQMVPLEGKTLLNVSLIVGTKNLGEVVVLGYSAQKKSTVTSAVTSVNMKELESRRVVGVAQVLQGQVAGVQVTQSTGAPGDPIEIRIRGVGTIGNNDPLYIIDGVPSRDITFLNPSDIKTMTVLKDAAAAAIYGSRASGGVVVITTKQGEVGKTNVNVNYYSGIQSATHLPHMLNSTQYMNVMETAWNNSGYSGTNPYTPDKGRSDFANTNWLDELFVLGHSQDVQASVSGGNEKTQFLLSADVFNQNGIVIFNNDEYKRINFRTNINSNITDRFRVGTNVQFSYTSQDKLSSSGDTPGIIRHACLRPPILSVYKSTTDPTYSASDPFTDLPFYKYNDGQNGNNGGWEGSKYQLTSNPIALAYFTNDVRSVFKTFGNVYGEYSFLEDKSLKARTNAGIELNFNHDKAFYQNFGDDNGSGNALDAGEGRQNKPNSLSEDRNEDFTLTWNNTLNYEKKIGAHSINALVGTEYISNHESSLSASRNRYDFTTANFQYINFGNTTLDLTNGGTGTEWALFSLFGSATYSYNDKYMVTANLRADASSRFSSKNRWGYFPSVSGGWNMAKEDFMKDISWLSDLRVRGSVGELGNQEIDNYSYLTLLKKDGDKYLISRYGNPDLKWESTKQTDFGVDLGVFSNRLYFSADYFIKKTSNILLPISLPSIAGNVLPTIINAGEIQNKGFEFALTYKNNDHAFKYSVSANAAFLKNMVEKLYPNLPSIVGDVTRTEAGHPLNSYYGYVMDGIYQNTAEIKKYLYGTASPTVQPGDIKFKDLNGDGIINDKDRTYIGNPNPRMTYGLSFSGSYAGFDLSFLFQGVQGVDRYNNLKQILDYDTRPFNHTTAVLNAWNGEGSSNSIPRVSFTDNGGSRVSNIFVEDASYLRLKNVELGYSFSSLMKKMNWKIDDVRLYVSAQNLFTVTDYTGLDPESTNLIDMGTYPQSRSFIFGVNVKF